MTLAQSFAAELEKEAASTLRLFEALPDELPDFKPHAKSMSFSMLASHVAELPEWTAVVMKAEELDFAKLNFVPKDFKTKKELIDFLNKTVKTALDALNSSSNEDFYVNWSMRTGDVVYFTMPRVAVMRSVVLNHFVHHRAQLTVYMRILDMKLPGMYGPSADEPM